MMSAAMQQSLSIALEIRRCCDGAERNLRRIDDLNARIEVLNRTIPVSSCGNHFESRVVGSSRSWKFPLNTAVAEKPDITVDAGGSWTLNVSPVLFNTRCVSMANSSAVDCSFKPVYVARVDVDTASSINANLEEATAGIFNLDAYLQVNNSNTVVLGLGMSTLVSPPGNVIISDTDVPGIRVTGLLLNAGLLPTNVLLEGRSCACAGDAPNPGMLHDVFAEVSCPESRSSPSTTVAAGRRGLYADR